jgi:hypothetical protein
VIVERMDRCLRAGVAEDGIPLIRRAPVGTLRVGPAGRRGERCWPWPPARP